jgi:hypothetical protein
MQGIKHLICPRGRKCIARRGFQLLATVRHSPSLDFDLNMTARRE